MCRPTLKSNSRSKAAFWALLLTSLLLTQQAATQAESWERVAPSLEVLKWPIPAALFSGSLVFLRLNSKDVKMSVSALSQDDYGDRNAFDVCRSSGMSVCVNANFFDENNRPLGLVVHRGTRLAPLHSLGQTITTVFLASRNKLAIVQREGFDPRNVSEAVQAGPMLLQAGARVKKFRSSRSERRAGLCLDKQERLIVFASERRFSSLRFSSLQEILLQPSIGCIDAMNLDGGSSVQLYLSPKLAGARSGFEGLVIESSEKVPVALGLKIHPAGELGG